MPAELRLSRFPDCNHALIPTQTGVFPMPTSLPEIYPALIVEPISVFRLPPGSWLLIIWTAVMLPIGLLASFSANTAALDQFQLLANF
jgi:hypothetical protein